MSHVRLALALALSISLAPLALDAYLPAFPAMAAALGVEIHAISLSVSVYIGALSIGQLLGGPLADRYGRQVIMLTGLSLFAASSFALSQVTSLSWLLVLRALQAFGGGWALVCVPALVRDRTRGAEAAKLFSLIGLMTVAAPALAPALGGILLEWAGWSSIFVFLAVYALLVIGVLRFSVFARRHAKPASTSAQPEPAKISIGRRYLNVLATPSALRFIFLQASVFSVMMLFITHASFIYQEHFGASTSLFAALFGANVVCMAVIMGINRVLLNRFHSLTILRGAVTVQAAAVVALLLVTQFMPVLFLFVPAMMVSIGCLGAITPNSQACYMEYFFENGGTAAALMGAMQFGISGLVSGLSALLPESILSIAAAQAVCALIGLALVWLPMQRKPGVDVEKPAVVS